MQPRNDIPTKHKRDIVAIVSLIISIFGAITAFYYAFLDHDRDIRITNVRIYSISDPVVPVDGDIYEYIQAFIDSFSDTFVQFHAENHSSFDIEIYGFYFEIEVEGHSGNTISIPLETAFNGNDQTISTYLNDWEATMEISKYVLKSQTTSEAYSDVGETVSWGPASWYISSPMCDEDSPVLPKLQSALSAGDTISFKCRIVCKDSFNNLYHSKWFKYNMN